jgi:hypothetical protein
MATRDRQLGWPFWVGSTSVFLCLTLGTFTILGKNFANNFYVAGTHQFESVGPATVANIVAQLLLAAVVAAVALARPTWRSAAFCVVALVSVAVFILLNAWAQTSVP